MEAATKQIVSQRSRRGERGSPLEQREQAATRSHQAQPLTSDQADPSSLWQLVLTVISIRTKNTIQVSAVTLFNFAFLAWAVIQVNELQEILGDLNSNALALDGTKPKLITLPLNILTGIIIAVVAAGCLALSVLTYVIRKEFG